MRRYDLVLDPTGECDCCRLEHPGGKFVLLEDHAAAIAEKDAEIAALNTQLENVESVLAVLVRDIQDREILIPKLRKVVDVVRGVLARPGFGVRYQNDRIALDNALAELDKITKK